MHQARTVGVAGITGVDGVHNGIIQMPAGGMNDYAGRFIQNQKAVIFENNSKRVNGRRSVFLLLPRDIHEDSFAGQQVAAGPAGFAVYRNLALLDHFLKEGARAPGHFMSQELVQTHRQFLFGDLE